MSAYSSIAKLLKAKAAVYNIGISSNMWIRVACIITRRQDGVNRFGKRNLFFSCSAGTAEKQTGKTIGKKQAIHV